MTATKLIDGARGEGGGQLVRTAVAISAVTGTPVRIEAIRARRRKPGLAAQHVAAVRAVAALCDADCQGVQPGSGAISFVPRRMHGGEFEVDVGTAGSITLVLLPLLARMGVRAELTVERRGYFPRGGGAVRLALAPVARLMPLELDERGPVERIEVHAHVARLPLQIAQRMEAAARAALPPGLQVESTPALCPPELALGPGGAIVLCALTPHTVLGAAQVADRGVRAERLGEAAGRSLARDLAARATLDAHATDQMLVFLAMADGESRCRTAALDSHARTAIWLLEQLMPARFGTEPMEGGLCLRASPHSG